MGYPSQVLTYPYCRYRCTLTAGPHLSLVGFGAWSGRERLDSLSLGDMPTSSHAHFSTCKDGQEGKDKSNLGREVHFVPQSLLASTLGLVQRFLKVFLLRY